jgi:pimeloyl-ACP methyl ester carboxylesterase
LQDRASSFYPPLVKTGDEGHEDGFARLPDGGKIAYQVRGRKHGGTPVLLVRPLGGSMALSDPFRAHLAEHHRVIAFDHRGSGFSSRTPLLTTTRGMARDTLHLLDHLGVERAHIFGISLGGMVASWIGILAPWRVTKLCIAAAPTNGIELTRAGLGRGLSLLACLAKPLAEVEASLVDRILSRSFRENHPEEVQRIERLVRAETATRTELTKLALAGARHDVRRSLHRISAPTLVLAGAHDALLGTEPPRALAAAIRGATFDVIADSGHDLTLEQPITTAARVAVFFEAS